MLSSYYKLYSVFNFLFTTTDIWICKTITHKTTFKNPVTFLTRADLYIQKHQVRHIKATLGVVLIPSIISSIGITTLGYIIKALIPWIRFTSGGVFLWWKNSSPDTSLASKESTSTVEEIHNGTRSNSKFS